MLHPDNGRVFVYCIDRNDLISSVNRAWLAFARENQAPELSAEGVLHKSLWDFIAYAEVRYLYGMLLSKVRATKLPVCVPFRCDSPARRRFMKLEIIPLKQKRIKFSSRILRQESRDPVDWLEASEARSEELVRMCSWCKKIHTGADRWLEIEDAIRELKLLDLAKPPGITHGFCPAGYQAFVQKLA